MRHLGGIVYFDEVIEKVSAKRELAFTFHFSYNFDIPNIHIYIYNYCAVGQ